MKLDSVSHKFARHVGPYERLADRVFHQLLCFQQFCERVIDCFGDMQAATVFLSSTSRKLP